MMDTSCSSWSTNTKNTNSTNNTSNNNSDFKKMGCSLLRQCRRRTQSEPPKNYKSGKLKEKAEKMRHSLDIIQTDRLQDVQDFTMHSPLVQPDYDACQGKSATHHTGGISLFRKKDSSKNTRKDNSINSCSCGGDGDGGVGSGGGCGDATNNIKDYPDNSCKTDKHYNTFDTRVDENVEESVSQKIQDDRLYHGWFQSDQGISKQTFLDPITSTATDSNEYLPDDFHFVEPERSNRRKEKFCFPKMICCRKGHRKTSTISTNNNNIKQNYSYTVKEYLKMPQSCASSSNVDSESTCVSSIGTGNNSSYPTLSSSSEHSRTFSSDQSSANISHDSGFDEPKCFIKMIYQNHKCKGMNNCYKKEKASLNLHLRNLMNCMPKSFSDCESLSHPFKEYNSGVTRSEPYLTKRRNAICETSEEMRLTFYEALCAFMTLRAMAKYDFL